MDNIIDLYLFNGENHDKNVYDGYYTHSNMEWITRMLSRKKEYIHEHDTGFEKQGIEEFLKTKPKIDTISGLDVKKIVTPDGGDFEQRPLMKEGVIPNMASSVVIVGGTGSGKTNLLVNMLMNSDMYHKYFDDGEVYLFSANGKTDDLLMSLGLPNERIISDRKTMIKELDALVKRLGKRCEEDGKYNAKRACIIFDDLTSIKKLQDSEPFIKLFTENRHHAAMVFALVHKYKGLNRTCRMQSHNLMVFPVQESDIKQITEDHLPPGVDKKTFMRMIQDYVFKPDESNAKPFLHINTKKPFDKRYRKSFNIIVDPVKYGELYNTKTRKYKVYE